MDFLERLQNIEKKINENKIQKAKLEQKKEQLKEEYEKLLAELKTYDVTEEDLGQTITNLEVEINESLLECESELK